MTSQNSEPRPILAKIARIAMAAALAVTAAPVAASIDAATWLSHRIIGVIDGSIVSVQSERRLASGFEYLTKSQFVVLRAADGCVESRVLLRETANIDEDASGKWTRNSGAGVDSVSLGLLGDMSPVVPSGWHDAISVLNGSVAIGADEQKLIVASAETVSRWAVLQGLELVEDIQLSGVFESADAWTQTDFVYLELETPYRDVDVDYGRFIVPIDLESLDKLLSSGDATPQALADTQPQPTGC